VSSTHALQLLQNINKVFGISRRNMYESFGLVGIQLPEKYKENFDDSSEGASSCAVSVCIHRT
jgi:hypothetical protein